MAATTSRTTPNSDSLSDVNRDSVSGATVLVLPKRQRKPSPKKGSKPADKPDREALRDSQGFQRLQNGQEPLKAAELRQALFIEKWGAVQSRIDELLVELNTGALDTIVQFVSAAYAARGTGGGRISLPFRELPTALMFAGINIPDHDLVFSQIATKLSNEAGHLVATLPSKDCPTLKSAIKNLIEQFLGLERDVKDDDVDEVSGNWLSASFKSAKLPNYDMQILDGWFRQLKNPGNLVIIIPDFEAFDAEVLQDLITICSEYQDRLPIVMVLGIATFIEALHQSLPRAVLSLVRTETFKLRNATDCVNSIVEEIFVKNLSNLKLGFEPYKLLIENFQLHTLSVGAFVRGIHYAFMDHYYSSPLSVLTDVDDANAKLETTGILTEEHAIEIRMLKSFRRYIESIEETEPLDARKLLLDDKHLFKCLPKFIAELRKYHSRYQSAFSCLLVLQTSVKSPNFNRPKRTLHTMSLSGTEKLTEYISVLLSVWRKRKVSEMKESLEQCLQALEALPTSGRTDVEAEISLLKGLLNSITQFEASDEEESSSSDDEEYLLKYGRKRLPRPEEAFKTMGRTTNVAKKLKPIVERIDENTFEGFAKKAHDFFHGFLT
ncbi:hypothetical protein HK104_003779 [Borealophlyctis nickersoniae]|nr:hypothetical protein HK104_003779 [Borealophlyctis nickersoniae]